MSLYEFTDVKYNGHNLEHQTDEMCLMRLANLYYIYNM